MIDLWVSSHRDATRRDAVRRFYIERLIIYFIYYTKRYTFHCESSDTLRCAALHLETPRGAARHIAVSGGARLARASLMVRSQDAPRGARLAAASCVARNQSRVASRHVSVWADPLWTLLSVLKPLYTHTYISLHIRTLVFFSTSMEERDRCYSFTLSQTPHETQTTVMTKKIFFCLVQSEYIC
jgi:hypothetical protein